MTAVDLGAAGGLWRAARRAAHKAWEMQRDMHSAPTLPVTAPLGPLYTAAATGRLPAGANLNDNMGNLHNNGTISSVIYCVISGNESPRCRRCFTASPPTQPSPLIGQIAPGRSANSQPLYKSDRVKGRNRINH